jgi:MerR family copper efflux transcriptional regulator
MLISEIAKRAGVSKDTVRLYTKMGLLKPDYRQAGTRTYAEYSEDNVDLINDIILSKAAGFTLAEIQKLALDYFAGTLTPQRQKAVLIAKLKEVEVKQQTLALLAAHISDKIKQFDC